MTNRWLLLNFDALGPLSLVCVCHNSIRVVQPGVYWHRRFLYYIRNGLHE
jgi:hypothetical protein